MKVLYLEDNPLDADLLRRELVRNAPHITVDVVSAVGEALGHLAEHASEYDLVLADICVPDGNGLDLLTEIRMQGLPLPVIILTGSGK